MSKKKSPEKKNPRFPFDKMPRQDGDEALHDYDPDEDVPQELDLGESDLRSKRRSLRDERNAGQEP